MNQDVNAPTATPMTHPTGTVKGLSISRRFTREGDDAFASVEYETRSSVVCDEQGQVTYQNDSVEVPRTWSQEASDVLAQKYFLKTGVPEHGSETSVKQVVYRLVGGWRAAGEAVGYFAKPQDAQAFYDEVVYMLLHQMASPSSALWCNAGVKWAYGDGIVQQDLHTNFIQSVADDLVNEGGIMDLWMREARLFKQNAGTGTNFSALRGRGEKISGGTTSNGLIGWLEIGDAAAAAVRLADASVCAAKIVVVDIDHPDIEEFLEWKSGDISAIDVCTNAVRVSNAFLEAVNEDREWNLRWRTDGRISKTVRARELWARVCSSVAQTGQPALQFDTTINEWHTCIKSGRVTASSATGEYIFLDNTASVAASLNLAYFFDARTMVLDVDSFRHAARIWTVVLEISAGIGQLPSADFTERCVDFRPLALGFANLSAGVLMAAGIAYDSREAAAIAAAISAILAGEAYATSAEIAKYFGPFAKFELNRSDMLRVVRNHRRAAYNAPAEEYEKISAKPVGIDPTRCPVYLVKAARAAWDRALELGEIYGYRNAQTTLLAPVGSSSVVMDAAAAGIDADDALVKFKKSISGGYVKVISDSALVALRTLGYSPSQTEEIVHYMRGTGTLAGAPHINIGALQAKGFNEDDIAKMQKIVPHVFEIQFAFNAWTLGEDLMKRLGFGADQFKDLNFNMLSRLGFTDAEIAEANEYVCGTMTVEGAPFVKPEHYAVFACAHQCGKKGERLISSAGHIRMMAAVQPFLSGAIAKTISLSANARDEDTGVLFLDAWRGGVKSVSVKKVQNYWGSAKNERAEEQSLSFAPASLDQNRGAFGSMNEPQIPKEDFALPPIAFVEPKVIEPIVEDEKNMPNSEPEKVPEKVWSERLAEVQNMQTMTNQNFGGLVFGQRRALPAKRSGLTIEAKIGEQQVYLRTGEYADGTLGEIFIDMYREGAAFRSVLNCFAISVSLGLQHGVPLEKYVDLFTQTRFEPSGFTTHPNIKNCTSIFDYIFRVLAVEYLGRNDLAEVPPDESVG